MQQKFKIRLEIGPGIPSEMSPFLKPESIIAIATAALRSLTIENVYVDTECVGTKNGTKATVAELEMEVRCSDGVPSIVYSEAKGIVILELRGETEGTS